MNYTAKDLNPVKDFITWTNKWACGIKVIDDQHKALVELVNDLFKHVTGEDKQEHDYFDKVIQELVNYVKVHFAAEEKILIATKYAGYAEHKKQHDLFIRTVVENIKLYEAGKRYTLSTFARFLKDWILSHIAMMDKQYFEYLHKIASRKADGKLSINKDDVNNL
ncbi:MAG: bacteriohemerythrin [Treponema sp.]|nr:bacteriohemerythrin [Treponema sp.]